MEETKQCEFRKAKKKVEGLYSNDDATSEEIANALKELSTTLNA